MKTRTLPVVGLAMLFFASLAGVVGQLADATVIGEFPLALALWLAALLASAVGLGLLAVRGRGQEFSGHNDALALSARDVMEKAPVGLAVYDADGRLAMCNGLWRTVFADVESCTAIGSSYDDCVPPAFAEAAADGQETRLAGERQLDGGMRVRFGEARFSDGGTLVSVSDVTDEHLLASQARDERERSRLIMSAAGAWIWETDVLHRFSVATPVRSEVQQRDLDWMIGRSLAELARPPEEGGDGGLSKCIETLRGHRRLTDARLVLHDGARLRAIRLSGVPRIDDDGMFLGYCGVGLFDTLPAEEAHTKPETAPVHAGEAGATLGQRVLLVDDSQTNRLLGISILQKMGYEGDAVENGQQAIDAVREGIYGLVLMDIRMPGMDGFEATSQIRNLPGAARTIPIVAMTAHMNAEDRQLCLDSGMDDHVSKPVDRRVLSSVLHRLIGPPDAADTDGSAVVAVEADTDPDQMKLADEATLEQLRNDAGPDLVTELIASFMTETDERLARMRDAMQSGDLDSIAAEAHAMKSSSGTFGALRLQRHVQRLEAAATANDAETASELLGGLPDLVAESWSEFARAGYPPPA